MTGDNRAELYGRLHRQHSADEAARLHAARRVLETMFSFYQPGSLLDIGCGRGVWLAAAASLGVPDVKGLEGPWLNRQDLFVAPELVETADLEQEIDLGRRYDLVVSIEVAEHLSGNAARGFVSTLARHGEAVLFSAAIPHQPGTGHINSQFLDYWAALFAERGYRPVDLIRPRIWTDRSVHMWIRQNVVLFVSQAFLNAHGWAQAEAAIPRPLSIVHPEMYMALVRPAGR